jgi:hypothetical protein
MQIIRTGKLGFLGRRFSQQLIIVGYQRSKSSNFQVVKQNDWGYRAIFPGGIMTRLKSLAFLSGKALGANGNYR